MDEGLKNIQINKLNKTNLFLFSLIVLVLLAVAVPGYVVGAGKLKLMAQPNGKSINLSWETKLTKADTYIIKKTVEGETYDIKVSGKLNNYSDQEVLPRTAYSYKVFAYKKGKQLAVSNELKDVILVLADNPHGMYSSTTSLCRTCHSKLNLSDVKLAGEAQTKLCFECHNQLKDEIQNLKKNGSSHPIMGNNELLKCSNCHNPHKKADETNPKILEVLYSWDNQVNRFTGPSGDDFCFACHDGKGGSKRLIDKDLYTKAPAHSTTQASLLSNSTSKISCNNCHIPHASKYKNLLNAQYDPLAKKTDVKNNQLCLNCHGIAAKSNILNYYKGNEDGVDKGHYIKDKNLAKALGVSVGWKLSCSDCHSTHGSKNDKIISDQLGDFTSIVSYSERERAVCSSCHAYSDSREKSSFRGTAFNNLPNTVNQHRAEPSEVKFCSSCHGHNNPLAGAHAPKSGLVPPQPTNENKENPNSPKVTEPEKTEEPDKIDEPDQSVEPVASEEDNEPTDKPAEKEPTDTSSGTADAVYN